MTVPMIESGSWTLRERREGQLVIEVSTTDHQSILITVPESAWGTGLIPAAIAQAVAARDAARDQARFTD